MRTFILILIWICLIDINSDLSDIASALKYFQDKQESKSD